MSLKISKNLKMDYADQYMPPALEIDFDPEPVPDGPRTVVSLTRDSEQSHLPLASATAICDRNMPPAGQANSGQIKVHTFKITVSVKGNISDQCVRSVCKALRKFRQIYVVCEQGAAGTHRHLHALVQSETPREKRNIQTVIAKVVKACHPDSNGKAVKVNTCYDTEWYDEYLRKEDGVENIDTDNFDIDLFRDALPDQATQDALQAAEGQCVNRNILVTHEERWIQYAPDDRSFNSAIRYLKWRQNVQRDMQPIIDTRRFRQLAYALTNFRNHLIEPDHGDLRHYQQESQGLEDRVYKN